MKDAVVAETEDSTGRAGKVTIEFSLAIPPHKTAFYDGYLWHDNEGYLLPEKTSMLDFLETAEEYVHEKYGHILASTPGAVSDAFGRLETKLAGKVFGEGDEIKGRI